jgi:hypothetical protein
VKNLLRIEELSYFVLSIFLFVQLDYAWWWYPLLFFLPDLGMLGYLRNPKMGALIYNLIHHKGFSLAIYIIGYLLGNQILQLAGLIIFGHSSLDRVLDYGLKYADSFQHTHLGMIGKAVVSENK